jgi:hypothetical protein
MDMSEHRVVVQRPALHVDVESVADAVQRQCAQVPRARIVELLLHLLAHEFQDARVAAYVPIFLQRAARERLAAEHDDESEAGDARRTH